MSDRNDPSQYPTADQWDDGAFFGDTTTNNHQLQSNPSGVYAEADELVGYENTGIQDDHMTRNPGKYNTKVTGQYFVMKSRPLPGATGSVTTSPAHIVGWALRETTGAAPATVTFRDGNDRSNPALITLTLAANESTRDFLPLPLEALNAVFIEIVTGTIAGNLYTSETRYV